MMMMWIGVWVGCGTAEEAHEHGPEGHEHLAEVPPPAPPPVAPAPVRDQGHTAGLGDGEARLTVTSGELRLHVSDGTGAPVVPEGDARVVFTPQGGEEQRLVLVPAGNHWAVATEASGEGGIAVVAVDVDGVEETARIAWGDAAATPPDAHDP